MGEFSKSDERATQAALGPVLANELVQIGLDTGQMRVDERFACLVEALFGHEVDVLVIVVEEDQVGLDGEAQELGVLVRDLDVRRHDALVDEIEIGDLVLLADLFEIEFSFPQRKSDYADWSNTANNNGQLALPLFGVVGVDRYSLHVVRFAKLFD